MVELFYPSLQCRPPENSGGSILLQNSQPDLKKPSLPPEPDFKDEFIPFHPNYDYGWKACFDYAPRIVRSSGVCGNPKMAAMLMRPDVQVALRQLATGGMRPGTPAFAIPILILILAGAALMSGCGEDEDEVKTPPPPEKGNVDGYLIGELRNVKHEDGKDKFKGIESLVPLCMDGKDTDGDGIADYSLANGDAQCQHPFDHDEATAGFQKPPFEAGIEKSMKPAAPKADDPLAGATYTLKKGNWIDMDDDWGTPQDEFLNARMFYMLTEPAPLRPLDKEGHFELSVKGKLVAAMKENCHIPNIAVTLRTDHVPEKFECRFHELCGTPMNPETQVMHLVGPILSKDLASADEETCDGYASLLNSYVRTVDTYFLSLQLYIPDLEKKPEEGDESDHTP